MNIHKLLNNTKKEDGQIAIFIVFVIMSLLLFMTLFLLNMTRKQTKNIRNSQNSVQAYYNADMGAEKFLWEIRNNLVISEYSIGQEIISLNSIDLNTKSTYSVIRISPLASESLSIKSSGIFNETLRVVKLSW